VLQGLTGWAAFRAFRKEPAPIPTRRHGNWVHGGYSRAYIEGMRNVRRYARIARGAWYLFDPDMASPVPAGWNAYRTRRPSPD
jgi:hypothetical protein